MIGGFVFSLLVFGVGAVLDFAVTVSPYQGGVNLNNVGVILMIVGAIGAVVTLMAMLMDGHHRIDSQTLDSSGHATEFHEEVR